MVRKECSLFVGVILLAWLALFPGTGSAAQGYFLQADVVRAAEGNLAGPACVPNSVFFPGEGMSFRIRVFDGETGVELSQAVVQDRGVQVTVRLSNGQTLPAPYIPHPPVPSAPRHSFYWANLWMIPGDSPSGTITWEVSVSDKQGREGHFAPIGQELGLVNLQIVPRAK